MTEKIEFSFKKEGGVKKTQYKDIRAALELAIKKWWNHRKNESCAWRAL